MISPVTRLCALFASVPLSLFAVTPSADPWSAARMMDFPAASQAAEALNAEAPDEPRFMVTHAAGLLARQPRTERNVFAARALLERAAASPSAPDDLRALAAYLLARINHEHLNTPRLDLARATYEALRRDFPAHPLADQAGLQLALITAYQTPDLTPANSVAPITALLETIRFPAARREIHILLGRLHERERGEAVEALAHYRAAREIGCHTPGRDGELDLMIGTLAARLGQGQLAANHYLAFAAARPTDVRAFTARRLAAEATSEVSP